jgi:prephenate dehydrogenase
MIGIIGYGRFGRLMAHYLSRDFTVRIFDRHVPVGSVPGPGIAAVSLKRVCRQPVVILAVPISVMPSVLTQIAPLLRPGALVMDVCSVKDLPASWMQARLPLSVSILATHPMFGPDSAAQSLEGCKIALCPVRIAAEPLQKIIDYLHRKGLVVVQGSAQRHDAQMAFSLALTHFVGRALERMGAQPLEMDTEGYRRLLKILEVVTRDTWQLFFDMHRFNPYAAPVRQAFMEALAHIDAQMTGQDATLSAKPAEVAEMLKNESVPPGLSGQNDR